MASGSNLDKIHRMNKIVNSQCLISETGSTTGFFANNVAGPMVRHVLPDMGGD